MTFAIGDFVHTTLAHPNNAYEIIEVGDGWLYVDDNTVAKLSIPTETATIHNPCGDLFCRACVLTYMDVKGNMVHTDRRTGENIPSTADMLGELKNILRAHGIDEREILADTDPRDRQAISALLFFARRIVPTVIVH